MEVILDTSFILTCLKEKIDFFQAGEFGNLVLPLQVLIELEKLKEKQGIKGKEREIVNLALNIIEKNKGKFEIVDLGKKFADAGIKKYVESKNKSEIIVATIDKNLKSELKDKAGILVIRARKKIVLL